MAGRITIWADFSSGGTQDEAITHLQTARQINPVDIHCSFWLALAYQHSGRFPEAIQQYRRTLQLAPTLDQAGEISIAAVRETERAKGCPMKSESQNSPGQTMNDQDPYSSCWSSGAIQFGASAQGRHCHAREI